MISNLSERAIYRIKHAGTKEMIIAAILLLVLISLFIIPSQLQALSIKRQALPQYEKEGVAAAIGEIDQQAGNVKLASSEGKDLYIDTKTLNIKVVDQKTRAEWSSLSLDKDSSVADKSPLIIKYLGKDNSLYEWDAYTYAIQNGRYKLNQIENGVQIVFDFFETESYRLNEYVPQKILASNYQAHFIDKIDEKLAAGTITEAQALKFKDALTLTYQYDKPNDLYYYRFAGLPPLTLVRDLIAMTKAIDYTTEMLIEESSIHGLTVKITQPANFIVTMEATLDKGDLVVKVPTYEIGNSNDFYTMQNISVLPSFGMAAAKNVQEGYIFVPDGAGALFKMNAFNGKYPEYERPIYNNTYYDTIYEMSPFPENLMMPVFGMYYTDLKGKASGLLGIVEKGAELGKIKVQLGIEDTSLGGTPYNKVFSSFDAMQFSRVKVFGPYSDNEARYTSSTDVIDIDYTVRYKLFGEKVSYYELAKAYQNHLVEQNGLQLTYEENVKPKLFLDVIGALTLEKRFLGIPYDKSYTMTSYTRLLELLQDLEGIPTVVNYKGVFNDGLQNTIGNRADLVKVNGSKAQLEELMSYAASHDHELFFNIDLMRVYEDKDGFKPKRHAVYGFNNKPQVIQKYNLNIKVFDGTTDEYLVNPLNLSNIVDGFIKDSQPYNNVFVDDFGSTYYASYRDKAIVNPIIANGIVHENLRKLTEVKSIALDNPNSDKLPYAKYAANISRESSDYGTMYTSVPFRQLVMNGLTQYTTLNVNLSGDRREYFILQALELGSIPKFTLTAENVDVLKYSEYREYFATEYAVVENRLKELYEEYSAGLEQIGSQEIINHVMLDENVFETSYASGAKVIVNYNKYPVNVAGKQLDALGYLIQ